MEDYAITAAESDKNTTTMAMEVAKKDKSNAIDRLVVQRVSGGDTESTAAAASTIAEATQKKKNLIQVSNQKKPFIFYLNLAKRSIKQYNDVELSALGMAIPTVVTIAEILKSNGLAIQKDIKTSTVDSTYNDKGRLIQKAKIDIVLGKAEKLDEAIATTAIAASKKAVDTKS